MSLVSMMTKMIVQWKFEVRGDIFANEIGMGKTIQAKSLKPEIIIYQKINLDIYVQTKGWKKDKKTIYFEFQL